jgi:hypothetical protein
MIDYATILSVNYLTDSWTLNGDDYDGLIWLSDTPKPTQAELDAQWASVQQQIVDAAAAKVTAREALLTRLGITVDEAQLLLGGM